MYLLAVSSPVSQFGHTPVVCARTFVKGQMFAQVSQIEHICLANIHVAVVDGQVYASCPGGNCTESRVSLNERYTQAPSIWLLRQFHPFLLC